MIPIQDEFLSEEDLDFSRLSYSEREAWCSYWLQLAQQTNDMDADQYSHGVFVLMREPR